MTDDPFARALDDLARGLALGPGLRVWSLVVTILGDSFSPRGGVARLGALQAILDRIDAPDAVLAGDLVESVDQVHRIGRLAV